MDLVVANQTLAGDQLLGQLRERMGAGPCHFHVLVPASPVDRTGDGHRGHRHRARLPHALTMRLPRPRYVRRQLVVTSPGVADHEGKG